MKRSAVLSCLVVIVTGLGIAPAYAAAPSNDNLANAESVVGASGTATGTNVDATTEGGEPGHPDGPFASVWYEWVAPFSGLATFDTCGSDFDTQMAGYPSDGVTQLDSNDDTGESGCIFQSSVAFGVTSGQTYFIAVDGTGGATGNVTLNWESGAAPANDDFANAQTISGTKGSVLGTNENATSEASDPDEFGPTSSVWYQWVAPASGRQSFHLCYSDFDTVVAVLDASLNVIAIDDDGCFPGSFVSFGATAGQTYYIMVGGYSGETGEIAMKWEPIPVLADLRLKRATDASFIGDDVYEDPWDEEGFPSQSVTTKVRRGKTARFVFSLQNDGNSPGELVAFGCYPSPGFKVRFFRGTTDVTVEMQDFYETPTLSSGQTDDIELRVTVSKKAKGRFSCDVYTFADGSGDFGFAVVKVKR